MHNPFEKNPDLESMLEVVREFCADQAGEPVVRRIMENPEGFDRSLWQRLGQELGILGLGAPERLGGLGLGVADQAALMEALGAALMPGPLIGTLALAMPALGAVQDHSVQSRYLPSLISGDMTAAFAVPDHGGRFFPQAVEITAREEAGEWLLDGSIDHVVDAPIADLFIVAGRDAHGVHLWSVEKEVSGLSIQPEPVMDLTRRQGNLQLQSCRALKIVDQVEVEAVCNRAFLVAGALLASEQAGAAGRILDVTIDYVANRVQFGRTIGSFQAIKHRCADLLVAVEHARSVARHAAWAIDEQDPDAAVHVAVARSICSDAFYQLATVSIQLLGGIGFTWEHPAHLYLKRAIGDSLLLGTARQQRELIAAYL